MVDSNRPEFNGVDLDSTLDDIEELPGFISPVSGGYALTLKKIDMNEIDNHPGKHPSWQFVIDSTDDLGKLDPGELPPKPGDMFSILTLLDNEFGASQFKKMATPIAEGLGMQNKSKRELIESVKNVKVAAVIKRTWNEKNQRHNVNIVNMAVL